MEKDHGLNCAKVFKASIKVDGQAKCLGMFVTAKEAAERWCVFLSLLLVCCCCLLRAAVSAGAFARRGPVWCIFC